MWFVAYAAVEGSLPGAQRGVCENEAQGGPRHGEPERLRGAPTSRAVADTALVTEREPPEENHTVTASRKARPLVGSDGQSMAYAHRFKAVGATIPRQERDTWSPEPAVGRVAHGVSHKLAEPSLRALGNAIVPQVAQAFIESVMDILQ